MNEVSDVETLCQFLSHDLKSPLRAMIGYSSSILNSSRDTLTAENEKKLERIVEVAQRTNSLVDGILGLVRISNRILVKEQIDIAKIANSIFEGFKSKEPDRNVNIRVSPDLCTVADATLITYLLEHLIENSWLSTKKRASAEIEIGIEKESFFVRDNGIGFDMNHAHHLCEPLYRINPETNPEGLGLGLAICKRIIERHDGKFWFLSRPKEGATFYFSIKP